MREHIIDRGVQFEEEMLERQRQFSEQVNRDLVALGEIDAKFLQLSSTYDKHLDQLKKQADEEAVKVEKTEKWRKAEKETEPKRRGKGENAGAGDD